MAALQLSEMRDEIKANLANRTDLSDSRLTRLINLTVRRIARRFTFDEMNTTYTAYTTSAGDADIDMTDITGGVTDLKKIYDLYLTLSDRTYYPQWKNPTAFFDQKRHDGSVTNGTPAMYTIFGDQVMLHRPADDTYNIVMPATKWPADLSGDTDTTELTGKDDVILALTTSWAYASLANDEKSSFWFGIFRSEMQQILLNEHSQFNPDISADSVREAIGSRADYWVDPFVMDVRT